MPLTVGIPRSIKLIEEALAGNHIIGLVAMRDPTIEEPVPGQVYEVGTVALVHRVMRTADGTLQVVVQGLERFQIDVWTTTEPYLRARVKLIPDTVVLDLETEALHRSLVQIAKEVAALMPNVPEGVGLVPHSSGVALRQPQWVRAQRAVLEPQAES
jgi:ATP-dependent Lon protease